MEFVIQLLISALALYLTTQVYGGIYFDAGSTAFSIILAALVMGLANAVVRPIVSLLSLPVTILTLGLFALVINGLMLYLTAALTALNVVSFGAAIIGAIILSLINWLLYIGLASMGLNTVQTDRINYE